MVSLNIQIQTYNMWIPQADFDDNCNIMERAIKNPYFTAKSKWKLEIGNYK